MKKQYYENLNICSAPQSSLYWAVAAKGGHVGYNRYIPLTFAVKAPSAKEAAARVKYFPRIKRRGRNSILSVTPIDFKRALEITQANLNDPYFNCHCIQDQRAYVPDIETRVIEENFKPKHDAWSKDKEFYAGKTKIRKNPKLFRRYHPDL